MTSVKILPYRPPAPLLRANYKVSIQIRENLVDLKIKIIIEKNTNPSFAAAHSHVQASVVPSEQWTSCSIIIIICSRLLFRSQPVKHLFSFDIVSQSPDIEGNYFQIWCIMSNEGG